MPQKINREREVEGEGKKRGEDRERGKRGRKGTRLCKMLANENALLRQKGDMPRWRCSRGTTGLSMLPPWCMCAQNATCVLSPSTFQNMQD